jgi:hypothetical protein
MKTSGYSTAPLFKKFGLKEGFLLKLVAARSNYKELFDELSDTLVFKNKTVADLDFIHLFTNSIEELKEKLPQLKEQIKKGGMIWVSWYKRSSGKATELSDNIVRMLRLQLAL